MMPIKCRSCEHYCVTPYKHEYHGYVEGCDAGILKAKYPYCYDEKEQDDGMEV